MYKEAISWNETSLYIFLMSYFLLILLQIRHQEIEELALTGSFDP